MKLHLLQQAADGIYQHANLGALQRIVCNHQTRRDYIAASDNVRVYNGKAYIDDIHIEASRGLPDNWMLFDYGDRWFGVNTSTGDYDEIERSLFR